MGEGAVPGAAELAEIRKRAELWGEAHINDITVNALYDMAESARDDLPALLSLVDALTGALALAVEPWQVVTPLGAMRCRFCRALDPESTGGQSHDAACPVAVLARVRGEGHLE